MDNLPSSFSSCLSTHVLWFLIPPVTALIVMRPLLFNALVVLNTHLLVALSFDAHRLHINNKLPPHVASPAVVTREYWVKRKQAVPFLATL